MGNKKLFRIKKLLSVSGRMLAVVTAAAVMFAIPSGELPALIASGTDYDSVISDYESQIKEIQAENAQREEQIDSFSGDISENESAMSVISDQIDGVNAEITTYGELITAKQDKITAKKLEIEAVEAAIADKELEIEDKKAYIAELEEENEKNLQKFAKLARALYMNNTSDTLPILNGSDDWYNYFVYTDVVQNIGSQNLSFMNSLLESIREQEEMIDDLDAQIAKLEEDKAALAQEKETLESEMADLESEKSDLEEYVSEQTSSLYAIAAVNQSLQDKVDSLQYQIDASNAEVEELNKAIEEEIRKKQAANTDQVVYSTDGFRWPLDSQYQMITTYFGYDAWRGGNHYGIDVGNAGIGGQNIYAAQSGTVITAYSDGGYHGGFGNYVVIDHGGGISTLYAHCSGVIVYEGQTVNKGDIIGYVGSTGWSTGNHLHFEVRVNGTSVNPFNYSYEYV